MRYLVDTNILLRLADNEDAKHPLVSAAVNELVNRSDEIVIAPQCIYELWAVVTRPRSANGLEWTLRRTRSEVNRMLRIFTLLSETPEVFTLWLELVTKHQVHGKKVHDTKLAAIAKAHNIEHLLTPNVEDFKRFDLSAVHPNEVVVI
jgi:predicted nucleic acid-binding protein